MKMDSVGDSMTFEFTKKAIDIAIIITNLLLLLSSSLLDIF